MPTIGPAFEPLPDDPDERAEVDQLRDELQDQLDRGATHAFSPSFGLGGPARPARPDPDRPGAEGRAVSAELRAQVLVGGAIVASLALVGDLPRRRRLLLRAGEDPGPLQAPALAQPRRPRARSPSSSRSRRSTAPPASSGSAGRRWPGRWRRRRRANASPSATGSTTRSWREAIRAGLLRAVDDAEDAGALSPLLAGPLRGDGRRHPARPGDRTDQQRPLAARQRCRASSAPPRACSKNSCPSASGRSRPLFLELEACCLSGSPADARRRALRASCRGRWRA